ncbi:fatty-acid-binding protein 2 isoform X2 [Juglans microcarpa x Juglans regia]|uniref:fatty-acid-binding protein 2 isoform X2 n=1 Tax=Juglans microcarpa x Juglans regia TaxID=2249226 RepID=UPI001B7EA193|nr:fatty-acid-binding protein 2 isoform X2 [Juglans microcarpa x Juglans regia]
MDLDGGSPDIIPIESFVLHNFGGHLFSQISSFLDNSMHQSQNMYVPGSLALREAFNCVSKLAGALLFWFSSTSTSNMTQNITSHGSKPRSPASSTQMSSLMMKIRFREAKMLQSYPLFSLAAVLIPPFDNLSSEVLTVSLENTDVQVHGCMGQRSCEVENQRYTGLALPDLNRTRHAVEPRTGIEFPMILDNILAGEKNSSLSSEVLVGTGSRTMKILKIKSLKIYAFGFYVHPYSVCEKLGPKYASISVDELNKRNDFYEDLLRENINMAVRLVVNYNGIKINTVKDAFEKSLRARLVKINPDTDYHCVRIFGSHFTQDIPIPAGTTIDFRRTADGQLITEIGGNKIGVVHSKDLCRAFFDMYIGDVPVSVQTKEEIGKNVAHLIRRGDQLVTR